MAAHTSLSINGLTDLQNYVINNNIERSQAVLAAGGEDCKDTPLSAVIKLKGVAYDVGSTAIHMVQSPEMLQILMNHKYNVNQPNASGKRPLHLTIKPDVAKALLDHNADPLLQDKDGNTPLHVARTAPLTRLLLVHGVDPNIVNKNNATPLFRVFNDTQAELLIKFKADVNHCRDDGVTSLHLARSPEIAKRLIANNADVNAQQKHGYTPLHWSSDAHITRCLLDNGANVSATAANGKTPLHMAWDGDMARALIDANANVNAKDNNGQIPLHHPKTASVAQVLIEHGADPNSLDNDQKPPLFYVTTPEISSVLKAAGALPAFAQGPPPSEPDSLDAEIQDTSNDDEGTPTTISTSSDAPLPSDHTNPPILPNESLLELVKQHKSKQGNSTQEHEVSSDGADPTPTEAYQTLLDQNNELQALVTELQTRVEQLTKTQRELQDEKDDIAAKYDALEERVKLYKRLISDAGLA